MHVEFRELAATYRPDVREGRRKQTAGFLVLSGIRSQRNHPIPLGYELMRACGKFFPVAGKRPQQIVQDGPRPVPSAAIVGEALRLGPFDLRIEERKHCREIPTAERIVEATNGRDGCSHDQPPYPCVASEYKQSDRNGEAGGPSALLR